jgi:guanylate kinase
LALKLVKKYPKLFELAIAHITRPKRENEDDGK